MKSRYGKRARMPNENDLVLDSMICLDANIQEENLKQNKMSLKVILVTRKIEEKK